MLVEDLTRRTLETVCLIATLLTVVPLVHQVCSQRGVTYGTDEAMQVIAAQRLNSGLGYTRPALPRDLSAPDDSRHVIGWPPGVSGLVAALLRVGIPASWALSGLKIFFILMGVVCWYRLCASQIESLWLRFSFGFVVTSLIYSNTGDLVGWALMPWFISSLIALDRPDGGARSAHVLRAGFVAAVMVLFKFSILFAVGAGAFFLFWQSGFRLGRTWKPVAIFAAPATLVFVCVSLWNQQQSGHTSYVTESRAYGSPGFPLFALLNPVQMIALRPFHIDRWVNRGLDLTGANEGFAQLVLSSFVVLIAFLLGRELVRLYGSSRESRPLLGLLACLAVVSSVFFLSLDIVIFKPQLDSLSSGFYRYYAAFTPLVVVGAAMAVEARFLQARAVSKKLLVCGLAAVLLLSGSVFRHAKAVDRAFLTPKPGIALAEIERTIGEIRSNEPERPYKILGPLRFFGMGNPAQTHELPGYPKATIWSSVHVSEPTLLFVVYNEVWDEHLYKKPSDDLAAALEMDVERTGDWVVYHKKLEVGQLRALLDADWQGSG